MTDQQIIDNNKLIAEFDGFKLNNDGDYVRKDNDVNLILISKLMNYHNDWSWLMPVVKKIADTGKGGGLTYGLRNALIVANIDQTYKEIVEFIKWYNKERK